MHGGSAHLGGAPGGAPPRPRGGGRGLAGPEARSGRRVPRFWLRRSGNIFILSISLRRYDETESIG